MVFYFVPIYAQNAEPDFMRSVGKIYVVVATIVSIFIGIVVLLFLLERRISKLEKQWLYLPTPRINSDINQLLNVMYVLL